MAESPREEPPGGPESEAELSQRLALIKARSYGSTASVAAPLAERYVEHRLSAGDTLQGIALKYGVTVRPRGGGSAPARRRGEAAPVAFRCHGCGDARRAHREGAALPRREKSALAAR